MGVTGYCFKYIDRPFCLQTYPLCLHCHQILSVICVWGGQCVAEWFRHKILEGIFEFIPTAT